MPRQVQQLHLLPFKHIVLLFCAGTAMLLSLITLSLRYSGLGADFINQEMAYFAYISFGVTALNMVMEYIFLSEGEEPRGLNILN